MGAIFEELLQVYAAAERDEVEVAAESLMAWSASRLLAADSYARNDYWYGDWVTKAFNRAEVFAPERPALVWLASMSRDGHLRERAVTALADDPSSVADRLLAVRLGDFVPAVRLRAWDAIARRCSPDRVVQIVPVLVALRGRTRASDALRSYAEVFQASTGQPLWDQARHSDDRATRRWAMTEAAASGALEIAELREWSRVEPDQWIAAKLVAQIAASGDADDLRRLLTMKRPSARAAGLLALGQMAQRSEIDRGLLDRAHQVRTSAQWVATKHGIDVTEFYLEQWRRTGAVAGLAGAFEVGARFTGDEIATLCGHQDARVRNLALRRLGPDLAGDQVQLLIALLDDPLSASTATKVLARGYGWSYQEVSELWTDADAAKRGRLWRLLSSRGGWDRVRADLLAMTATDGDVAGLGRRDLQVWRRFAAASMFRDPTDAQARDIARDLATVEMPLEVGEAIEMRLRRRR
jgi:hypothetical protein